MVRSKAFKALPLVALLCGCATSASDPGLTLVGEGLTRRSGYSVAEAPPGERSVPASVNLQDGLAEREAILLSLANNAPFQSALADLGLTQAALLEAGLIADPNLGLVLSNAPEATLNIPIEFLWIRPRRLAAARLDQARTTERLVQSGLDLILDVKLRLADLAFADRTLVLADELQAQTAEIARLSAARVQAGDLTPLEAGTTEVDAQQAREAAQRARAQLVVARERVRDVTGLTAGQWTGGLEAIPEPAPPTVPLETLVAQAVASRPDVRAAEIDVQAAGERVGLVRAEALRLSLGVKWTGAAFSGTAAGPMPIFNTNRGGIASARARFEKAAYDLAVARAQAETEVRDAAARLAQAQASRTAWRDQVLPPLVDAQARYRTAFGAGDVTLLLLLENSRRLVEAQRGEAAAAADARRAAAQLERNVGGSLAGPSEVRS